MPDESLPTRAEVRTFAWTVGAAFVALALLLAWRGRVAPATIAGTLGLVLAVAGLAIPDRLGPVHRAWMGLATAMSRVTTPVLMAVIWLAVLTPLALVRRAMGKNALSRPRAESYWRRRDPAARRSDLHRQF